MTWRIRLLREAAPATWWPDVPNVFIADTIERCVEAMCMLRDEPVLGVDTETYNCDPKKQSPVGMSRVISLQLAGPEGVSVFVPLWGGRRKALLETLRPLLEDPTPRKVAHNWKWDAHALLNHGINLQGMLGDTAVMDYLEYNGEERHGLKECMTRYFGIEDVSEYAEVFREPRRLKRPKINHETGESIEYGKATWLPPLDHVIKTPAGIEKLIRYAVKDPQFTAKLYVFLRDKMQARPWIVAASLNYLDYYERIERPFTQVLLDMEREGCVVDLEHFKNVQGRLLSDIEDLERSFLAACVMRDIEQAFLVSFNMNSTKQVAELLYTRLKIKVEDRSNLTSAPSTATAALEKIVARGSESKRRKKDADLVSMILKHRRLVKLLGTYIEPFLTLAPQYKDKIHTNFKQTGTKTGRLSSSAPNLLNVPSGKKDDEYRLREGFIAPAGYRIGDIDLSQIEVRLTAHSTKDPTLIKLLQNKWDQHLIAAKMLFPAVATFCGDKAPDAGLAEACEAHFGKAVWAEYRRRGKIMNFGILYGLGPVGFMRQVGGKLTEEEAAEAIENYFAGFPSLREGIKRTQRECYERGYVRTLARRYIMIPDIQSYEFKIRARAERQAFNASIQGSCADLMKLAMLLCTQDPRLKAAGFQIVLQIYDELVFIFKEGAEDVVVPIVEEYVAHPYRYFERLAGIPMKDLIVDTPAEAGVADSWYDAKQ